MSEPNIEVTPTVNANGNTTEKKFSFDLADFFWPVATYIAAMGYTYYTRGYIPWQVAIFTILLIGGIGAWLHYMVDRHITAHWPRFFASLFAIHSLADVVIWVLTYLNNL